MFTALCDASGKYFWNYAQKCALKLPNNSIHVSLLQIYSDSKSCRSLLGDQANNSSFMMNLQDLKKANASDGIFFSFCVNSLILIVWYFLWHFQSCTNNFEDIVWVCHGKDRYSDDKYISPGKYVSVPERYFQTAVLTQKLFYLYVTGKIHISDIKSDTKYNRKGSRVWSFGYKHIWMIGGFLLMCSVSWICRR